MISWHSFDLRSGRRGPRLITQSLGQVQRIIGEPSDGSQTVLWYDATRETSSDGRPTTAGLIPGIEAATLPGRVMLVALDDDTEEPAWAGMVTRRRSDQGSWVGLDLVTLEGYFDRRYVKDHTYTQTAQGAIIEGILTADASSTGAYFVVDAQAPTPRDRTYADDDDKTVLSVMQDMMGVVNGAEFTVDLQWGNAEHTLLQPVVRIRERIGTASAHPPQFTQPGVTAFSYVEDYTSENGATDVLATSSGEGDTRPESAHHTALDLINGGWPLFEYRYSPSTSITETDTLDAHADSTLTEVRNGLAELTLTARLGAVPMPGVDFHLGDDVAVALTSARFPERTSPDNYPIPGYEKTVRCIGYAVDYDANTVEPRLVEVG